MAGSSYSHHRNLHEFYNRLLDNTGGLIFTWSHTVCKIKSGLLQLATPASSYLAHYQYELYKHSHFDTYLRLFSVC